MSKTSHCSIEDCTKPVIARGWCRNHYSLWHKHGKPERVIGRHGRNLKDPTYLSWSAMRARCSRGKYKGRFTVCERWDCVDGFVNFLEDMGERPKGKTLDRIDNSKGYYPKNCRWATIQEQRLNSPQLLIVEYKGVKKPLSEHCTEQNMPYLMVHKRLKRGWSVERSLEEANNRTKEYTV